jgi:hypothetical protein
MIRPPASTQEIVTDVDWRLAECARASTLADKHRPRTLSQRLLRTGFTTVVIAALVLTILGAAIQENKVARLLEVAPLVLMMGLWPAMRFGGAGWLAAWLIRQNNPNMVAGSRHVVSQSGYQIRAGQAQSQVAWPGIVRVVETGAFFLTFPTKSGAYYLPKRVLSAEQCGHLRSLVQQQAGDRFIQLAA